MLGEKDIVELEDNLVMLTKLQSLFESKRNRDYMQQQIDSVKSKISKLRKESRDGQRKHTNHK